MTFMFEEERALAERFSALARCNPFLPERVQHELNALGPATFEKSSLVWSKREDRENSNVYTLEARADSLGKTLKGRLPDAVPDPDEKQLYQELVFYRLYYRFEEAFEHAAHSSTADFYDDFASEAAFFLGDLPRPNGLEELPHWFAFLYQIRRASHHIFDFIVGSSLPAAKLRGAIWQSIFTHDLRRYRRTLFDKMGDVATLITGPSGTGKELVARAIGLSRYIPFQPSQRRFAIDVKDTFYPLNLSALPSTLIESELFGHRRGAFTGALADRKGWLSICPELGTVFLDEIGELDPTVQVKLLRVLQSREFQPLGEARNETFEGKIVAATNRNLGSEIRGGPFREDLYYRLCSDLITTPQLREQLTDAPEDLVELVSFVARRVVGKDEASQVTDEVIDWIHGHLGDDYDWPGNFRELEQCVRNVTIRREYVPPATPALEREVDWPSAFVNGRMTAEELLEEYCDAVYTRTGTYLETAKRIGLDRRTVKAKVEAHRRRASDP